MSPASTVWQAKMDEISPNFVNFHAQLVQDLLQRKQKGRLKNGTFLQVTLNIAPLYGLFHFPQRTITTKNNYKRRILYLYLNRHNRLYQYTINVRSWLQSYLEKKRYLGAKQTFLIQKCYVALISEALYMTHLSFRCPGYRGYLLVLSSCT